MKTMFVTIAALAFLTGSAVAATEHCVTRNVTSNDNSKQGLSTVCDSAGGTFSGHKRDCETKKS